MNAAIPIAILAAAAQAQSFMRQHEDALIDFRYGWPAVVEEKPALRAILAREMEAAEAQAKAMAEEDREARRESGSPFHSHSFAKVWRVAGSTPRLLSLTAEHETFTAAPMAASRLRPCSGTAPPTASSMRPLCSTDLCSSA